MTKLSSADVAYYKENGYFLYKQPLFAPDKFNRLVAIFEEHLATKGSKQSDELDMPHVNDSRLMGFLMSQEARMVHGAKPNTSPRRRTGYTIRYFATSTKIYPEKNPGHLIWLARGKDLARNTYVNDLHLCES